MKKLAICIICLFALVSMVVYAHYEQKAKKGEIKTNNMEYENIFQKEITGSELATIINKTIDNNETNQVSKDENGVYIENDTNSIKLEIKFKQSDNIFTMEMIYNNKISRFVELYRQAKFKCTKLEYHNKTKFVKYLYFQEI